MKDTFDFQVPGALCAGFASTGSLKFVRGGKTGTKPEFLLATTYCGIGY